MSKNPNYNGSILIHGGLKPRGTADFPLMDAHYVVTEDGTRLDEKLGMLNQAPNNAIKGWINLLKVFTKEGWDINTEKNFSEVYITTSSNQGIRFPDGVIRYKFVLKFHIPQRAKHDDYFINVDTSIDSTGLPRCLELPVSDAYDVTMTNNGRDYEVEAYTRTSSLTIDAYLHYTISLPELE